MLRKLTPYLLFAALGLLMLAGAQLFPQAVTWLYDATTAPGLAASGAEVAAGQQGSGWVPSATVASKFITFAGAYVLAVILPWAVQHLTHPALTCWAKTRYKSGFERLADDELRLKENARVQLHNVIRAAAALVFAALVV